MIPVRTRRPPLSRLFLLLMLTCLVALAPPSAAWAQRSAHAAEPATGGITPEQARQALEVLNDPARRAAFAATLNAIIKAQPPARKAAAKPNEAAPAANGAAPAAAPAAAPGTAQPGALPIPLAPDSLGAEVLVSASALVNKIGTETMRALDTVQSLPLLWGWAVVMVTNQVARDLLLDVTWRVIVVLACAVAMQYALRRVMRRPIAALEALAPAPVEVLEPEETVSAAEGLNRAEEGDTEPLPRLRPRPTALQLLNRVPLLVGRLFVDLVPVLGIVLVGHLMAGSVIGGHSVSRLIILAVTDAYALSAALLCIARMLLAPNVPSLRLFHLHDETAAYLMRWTRRLIVIAVVGYAIGEAWLLLGLSEVAHDSFQKAVGLILHVCLAIIVLQSRESMRDWLSAPDGAEGTAIKVRNRLAAVWHWIALFFIVSVWLVWAIELPHGYTLLLHYSVITAAILFAARLALLLLLGGLDRTMRSGHHILGLSPPMTARVRAYVPLIQAAVRLAVYAFCTIALLQLYGLNTFVWLTSSAPGQRILSSLGTMLTTIVLAFGVWEMVNVGVQQHLERLQRDAQAARSARLRTLLPLLRTTLMITIATVAGLMVLSEIGINIAPLLAGAGILGVAIGFGSQKLVQDLITGIFLLLENAMQVGDVVTVSGLSGVVESLSVRTIRLRSEDGSIHVVPFSSVTTVTNMTRDYSRAVIVAAVAYKEDYDRVVEVLKGIAKEMRREPVWQVLILDDLEVWGLDQLADSSINIKCRIMCTPFGRWSVMREFNRRMKMRFDELGIEIPFPHRKLVIDGALLAPSAGPPALPSDATASDLVQGGDQTLDIGGKPVPAREARPA